LTSNPQDLILEYQKKYNKERGEIIKDYNKDYYNKQREKILAKAKTKVMCECGCEVQLFNVNCHKKTKKHLRLVEAKVALLTASASTNAT
jgi:predicted HD phosphohydrolase